MLAAPSTPRQAHAECTTPELRCVPPLAVTELHSLHAARRSWWELPTLQCFNLQGLSFPSVRCMHRKQQGQGAPHAKPGGAPHGWRCSRRGWKQALGGVREASASYVDRILSFQSVT